MFLIIAFQALHVTAAESFDLAERKERLPWIWQVPSRQPVPTPASTAATTDVDRFLRARLEAAGIAPAPPTDDRTWLRRVHFALIGLPPSPETVRAFLNDTSPAKRERIVDVLLQSPHFGERWARHWMDLVRYAESRGHESDFLIPNAWQYRDYLIRALNDDVPYDRFVAEHVAGDILPPRLNPASGANESVLGTGWAFLGEEVHSPVDIRQDECERIDNKVDVLSKTFLGLTVACARCHDHKFDAISQSDYYALSGFILGSSYRQVRFETMEQHARAAQDLEELRNRNRGPIAAELAGALKPNLASFTNALLAAHAARQGGSWQDVVQTHGIPSSTLAAWTNQLQSAATHPSHPLHLVAERLAGKTQPEHPHVATDRPAPIALPAHTRVIADFMIPGATPWKTDGPGFGLRPLSAGDLVLGTNTSQPIVRVMPYGAASRDAFWNRLSLEPGNESEAGSHAATARSGRMLRTPTVELASGRLHYLIRGKTRVYAGVDSHIMVAGPLHGGLVASFDGGPEPTWVTHDLTAYAGHRAHLEFAPDGDGELDVLLVVESPEKPAGLPSTAWAPPPSANSTGALLESLLADLTRALERLGTDTLKEEPRLASLANWLVRNASLLAEPQPLKAAAEFGRASEELARRIPWSSRTAISWMDGTGVDERLLIRGKPTRPGEVAPRSLPSAFGSEPVQESATSGRAELARQLTDPANPLVARVMVNRLWQHLFGRGIVATPDNFGFLGERPSHPELLDHLAWLFVHQDGWSMKRMIRRLLLTDTFAQSSRAATGRAAEIDPGNTLLHRMPIRRLEGEAIRDAVLVVSGRFDARLGGPPVPVHLTEFIIGRGRPDRSGPLDGEGRRSIYTAVPRNFLPTMMMAFDLPTPFSTVGRRNTTNVPGQPLVLMNDPFLHQQARFWAGRVLRTLPAADDEERLNWMFETAYARPPSHEELRACLESLTELRNLHASRADLDVWTDLGHALFNANEFIYLN
jgi:hypothetical protein